MSEPTITHRLSEDGLCLTSTLKANGATARIQIHWESTDQALKHYDQAVDISTERLTTKYLPMTATVTPSTGEFTRMKRILVNRHGALVLAINGGPPTWWLPRVNVFKARGGWLRRAYQLTWVSRKDMK